MIRSIIAIIITTITISPLIRCVEICFGGEQHSLLRWAFVVSISSASGLLSMWLFDNLKK
jgi:hypothetical protein